MTELQCAECGEMGATLGDLRLHVLTEHGGDDDGNGTEHTDVRHAPGPGEDSTRRVLGETVVLGLGTVMMITLCLYLLAVGVDLSLDWL